MKSPVGANVNPRPYFAVGQKPRPLAKNARRAGHPLFGAVKTWVRSLPPFAKSAKDGAPLVCGGVGKVHGSFVGSPWLCQGLRCLRMTAFRGRMRPFDNSSEDEAVRLMVSSFQNCHLERRERTRLRVCSRSRKTCYLPMRRTCRRVIAAECRQKSRSLDSALGMTEEGWKKSAVEFDAPTLAPRTR
jgi:hypothetical protein